MSVHDMGDAIESLGSPLAGFVQNAREGMCPFCGILVRPDSFRDSLSEREFEISGLCQDCQDQMFGA